MGNHKNAVSGCGENAGQDESGGTHHGSQLALVGFGFSEGSRENEGEGSSGRRFEGEIDGVSEDDDVVVTFAVFEVGTDHSAPAVPIPPV